MRRRAAEPGPGAEWGGVHLHPGEYLHTFVPQRSRLVSCRDGAETAQAPGDMPGELPDSAWRPLPAVVERGWVLVRTSVPNQVRIDAEVA